MVDFGSHMFVSIPQNKTPVILGLLAGKRLWIVLLNKHIILYYYKKKIFSELIFFILFFCNNKEYVYFVTQSFSCLKYNRGFVLPMLGMMAIFCTIQVTVNVILKSKEPLDTSHIWV